MALVISIAKIAIEIDSRFSLQSSSENDRSELLRHIEAGTTGISLAKKMGISRAAVYKILKEERTNR